MGDLDFDELDRAINELCETLDANSEPGDETSGEFASKDENRRQSIDGRADDKPAEKDRAGFARLPRQKPIQDVKQSPAGSRARHSVLPEATNSSPGDSGHGRFMDMIHPSSDAQLQHKHNFAPERQAELNAKLAIEAKPAESNQDDTKSQEPVQIAVSVDGGDAVIESTTKPASIQIDDSDNIKIDTKTETEPESEPKTEAEPESEAVAETGKLLARPTTKPQATTAGRRG